MKIVVWFFPCFLSNIWQIYIVDGLLGYTLLGYTARKIKLEKFINIEVLGKDFVDISYENALFLILENSIWLQLIYQFLNYNSILVCEISFRSMGALNLTTSGVKELTLCCVSLLNQPLWKIIKLILTVLRLANEIK